MTGCCVICIDSLATFDFSAPEYRRSSYDQDPVGIGGFSDHQAFIAKAAHDCIYIKDHFPVIRYKQVNAPENTFDGKFCLAFLQNSLGEVNLSPSEDITDFSPSENLVYDPVF